LSSHTRRRDRSSRHATEERFARRCVGQQTAGAEEEAKRKELRETLNNAVNASVDYVDAAFEDMEEERARSLSEVEEMRRKVQEDRAALEQEKAAMKEAHTFQNNKICLNVGGHRFETSRQTLTSIPDTYLSSMFSGRFELSPDADGSYFIDRPGKHFEHVLNFLRVPVSFKLMSSDATEAQRKKLEVEVGFYGLLDRMMPYCAQERVGRSLLKRACLAGTERALRTAEAQSRALVFVMGSTTPFLSEKFQDSHWVITDRVVNGSPVWAAEGGEWFMYRSVDNRMTISDESACAEGRARCYICNTEKTADVVAPTELPSDEWVSNKTATLATQYASAERLPAANGEMTWARVPDMGFTPVHGLDDDDPAMAEALAKLAALP
jgi:hypothetical protein